MNIYEKLYYDLLKRVTGKFTTIYSSTMGAMKTGRHQKVKYF